MFLVDMSFIDMDKLTAELTDEHRNYLAQEYQAGNLMFGGRKEPRTGGIIISHHTDEQVLKQMLDSDPFIKNGVATYTITEFTPVMASPEYADLVSV